MAIIAKRNEGGGGGPPAPAGTHPATCVQVIDLGTQYNERYDKHQRRVMLGWELASDERRNDGKPWLVFKRYSLGFGSADKPSNLRRDLNSWRGRDLTEEELEGFDLRKLLGVGCLVSVGHRKVGESTYTDVNAVTQRPKGMTSRAPETKCIYFDTSDPDMSAFREFGENLRRTIESSAEWKEKTGATDPHPDERPDDDGVPF